MNQGHKIIKYVAIAFAIYLVVSIIGGIACAAFFFINLFSDEENLLSEPAITIVENEINTLNIDIAISNLTIIKGDEFKVETNDKDIKIKQNETLLEVLESNKNIINKNSKSKVTIYVPEEILISNININSGAGKVTIDSIKTNKIDFELGAGNVHINDLIVNTEAIIEGGAGNIEIDNSILNNLDMEVGVGNVDITSDFIGINKIECGVGNLDLNLTNKESAYSIKINKGVGSAKVNNKNISNGKTIGDGENKIAIEGGVGTINITTN